MVTLNLTRGLNTKEEHWLMQNIGPRLHYIHNSIGGQGWLAKYDWSTGVVDRHWTITFEDPKCATWFALTFPQILR